VQRRKALSVHATGTLRVRYGRGTGRGTGRGAGAVRVHATGARHGRAAGARHGRAAWTRAWVVCA